MTDINRLVADLKRRLDTRLDDHLCEMKPDFDDSIVGFNEAWGIVRATFDEAAAQLRADGDGSGDSQSKHIT